LIEKTNKFHEMMVKLDFFPVYFPTGKPNMPDFDVMADYDEELMEDDEY